MNRLTTKLVMVAFMNASISVATPVTAQNIDMLVGARQTGPDSRLGYVSGTYNLQGQGVSGPLVRLDGETSRLQLSGVTTQQKTARLLAGYTNFFGTGSATILGGAAYVDRTTDSIGTISETGYYLGLEGAAYLGDRGYAAGITQYSSPDEAFYTRGFSTYLVADKISLGPDLSYLHEPDFKRATIGLRTSLIGDAGVFGVILGVSDARATGLSSVHEGFVELQYFVSY